MSRAFVKEADYRPADLRDRPISTHPTLSRPKGSPRLKELSIVSVQHIERRSISMTRLPLRLCSASFATGRLAVRRQSSWRNPADRTHVHFGTSVLVRREDGRTQTFRIVGEDEADPARGTISHVSPLARAVIGKSVGDLVTVLGREAEIVEIH